MSSNIQQIFVANPAASMQALDLLYLGRSPYGATDDMAITWANMMASITTLGTITTGVWHGSIVDLAHGGTNANLTANNGGIVWSNATQLQILAGTATANQIILSGSNAAPSWSTSTFASTYGASELLYSNGVNAVQGLATANNGVLITSAGGVPSISSTLPTAVQSNITQLGAQSQALDMNSHVINNVTNPTLAQDAATKSYVDAIAAGGGAPVYAASTVALTVTPAGAGVGATLTNAGTQATFALDGVNPPLNSRVLIKNQAAQSQNGVYTVTNVGSGATNWVLTRATDYDQPAEINATGLIPVQNGATQTNTGWINTTLMVTVDTTPITFVQFGVSFPVSMANGGTNASLTANNGGIVWSNATQMQILAGTATANQVLLSGPTATPAWSIATYPPTTTINRLLYSSANNVITDLATANDGVLVTNNTGVPSILAGGGVTGQILQNNAAAAPSWSTSTYPSVATSANTFLQANGTNWVASAFTFTAGGNVAFSGGFTFTGTITGNTNVTFPTSGTLATTSQALAKVDQTSGTVTMAVNTLYVTDNGASLVTYTLPATAAVGDMFVIVGSSSGGWKVAQASGQTCHLGSSATTTTTGALQNTNQYDCITLVCTVANTTFVAYGVQGNITIT